MKSHSVRFTNLGVEETYVSTEFKWKKTRYNNQQNMTFISALDPLILEVCSRCTPYKLQEGSQKE
jgi:hypothetical protein